MFRTALISVLLVFTISAGILSDKDNTFANKVIFGVLAAATATVITHKDDD